MTITLFSLNIAEGAGDDACIYVQDLHRLIDQVIVTDNRHGPHPRAS